MIEFTFAQAVGLALLGGIAWGVGRIVPELVLGAVAAGADWVRRRRKSVASLYWVDLPGGDRVLGIEVDEPHEKDVLEAIERGREIHSLNRENVA